MSDFPTAKFSNNNGNSNQLEDIKAIKSKSK